jgi:heat shock protein HslJ
MNRRPSSLLLCLLVPAACATTGGGQADIRGHEWRAIDVAGEAPTGSAPASLRLQRDRSVAGGSGGCNIWSGRYRLRGHTITIDDITSTRRACPPAVMRLETRFLSILQEADRYAVWPDGRSTLSTPAGRTVSFERRPPDPPTDE